MKVGFDPVGIKSIQSTFNANDGNAWESHLQAKSARKSRTTTRRNPAHLPAPDLLQRDFTTQRPNQIWLADITYIPTQEGWLYLAAILDLYSRRIVGWAMDSHSTETLTLAALTTALEQRRPIRCCCTTRTKDASAPVAPTNNS